MDIRALNLEVVEVETKTRPGCLNSSSTSPRCSCPPPIITPPETD